MAIKPVSGEVKSQDINDNFSYLDSRFDNYSKGNPSGTYKTLSELKKAFPNGNNNIYVVSETGNWYYWDGKDWISGGSYQATQMPEEFEELKIGFDKIEYETPAKANDLNAAKQLFRINNNTDVNDSISKKVDSQFSIGSVDESTGVINEGAWSVKIHSKMIEIKTGEMVVTKTTDNTSCIIFFYNNGTYVRNSGYFTGVRNDMENHDFTHIVIMAQFRDNTIIDSSEKFLSLASLITVEKKSNITPFEKIDHLEGKDDLESIVFEYGKVRNLPNNYETNININPVNNGDWKTTLIDCQEGDVFLITGKGGVAPRLWSFLNENNDLISMSKSSLTMRNEILIAPINSKKLILNDSSDEMSFKIKRVTDKEVEISENSLAVGSVNLDVSNVSALPEYNTSFTSIIIPIKQTQEFLIDGAGGTSPKLWSFLDKDLKPIVKQDDIFSWQHERNIIKPTNKTKYLAINSNLGLPYRLKFRIKEKRDFLKKMELSNNRKKQRLVPSTVQMTDFVNGLNFREQLNNPLFNFSFDGDKMAHSASFRIIDDKVYSTFYINRIRHGEYSTEHTQVLRVKNLDGTGETENYDICNIGDTLFGEKVTQLYDTVILDETGDIRILFVAFFGGQWHQLYKTFNPSTKIFSEPKKMYFSFNNQKEEFTTSGIKKILRDNNIYYPNFDRHANFIQKVSYRMENNKKAYYIGLGMKDFCFIAKTFDFETIEYVAQPDFYHTPQYEASVYVLGDEVFYFERQEMWEVASYSLLSKYNLVTGEWTEPVEIMDCQSRSDFLYVDNVLYLVHAPFNRNHIALLEINKETLEMSYHVQTANTDGLFFPFTQIYNNKKYIVATQNRKHITFSEFEIKKRSIEEVSDFLNNIFSYGDQI